jgi:hypothetical protein
MSALRPLQGDGALQLLSHGADQLQVEGRRRPEVEVVREPTAGIPDLEHERLFGRWPQRHMHAPGPPVREGVLEAIRQQLVQQEATGGGSVQADPHVLELGLQGNALRIDGVGAGQLFNEARGVLR